MQSSWPGCWNRNKERGELIQATFELSATCPRSHSRELVNSGNTHPDDRIPDYLKRPETISTVPEHLRKFPATLEKLKEHGVIANS